MRLLDLFSGMGIFSRGLESTGGFETSAFCEQSDFPRGVLAKHWPKVPCYDDVRTLTADRLHADGIYVDAISAGFPCQDISYAGPGGGLSGDRSGLWWECARLIGELGPRYALLENVSALLERGMGDVLGTLSDLGYDAEWSIVSACSVGATHMRRRVFVVAYPHGLHGREGIWHPHARPNWPLSGFDSFQSARTCARARVENPSELYRGADDVRSGPERNRVIGNSIYPLIPELIGRAILAAESAL